VSDPEEQFDTFVRITERYLQPTSPQEVNISSQMQAKIASRQDREAFLSLDGDSRHDVLQAPLKEIVRMLEDNLLTKFKQSPEMRKRHEALRRQNLCKRVSFRDRALGGLKRKRCFSTCSDDFALHDYGGSF